MEPPETSMPPTSRKRKAAFLLAFLFYANAVFAGTRADNGFLSLSDKITFFYDLGWVIAAVLFQFLVGMVLACLVGLYNRLAKSKTRFSAVIFWCCLIAAYGFFSISKEMGDVLFQGQSHGVTGQSMGFASLAYVMVLGLLGGAFVYAAMGLFMWLGDLYLYYTDTLHRVKHGKPRFWPFRHGNHNDE